MQHGRGRTMAMVLLTGAFATGSATSFAASPPANVDLRGTVKADASVTAAREALEARLGPLATVQSAPSGGVAQIGSPARLLTGPSTDPPETVALDYVRDHRDVFGVGSDDIALLRLVARSVSPDGITHLRYNQVLDGIESFDSGLTAHVTRDGRLITVSGAPLPGAELSTTKPKVGPTAGLGEARDAARGSALAPAVTASAGGHVTFSTGETAALRWAATDQGPRLAWSVITDGQDDASYAVLVDATDGDTLSRTSLTAHEGQARHFVKDPDYAPAVQTAMPSAWYDDNAGGTRLWGNLARTYLDPHDEDPSDGAEAGGTRVQIPQSGTSDGGPDWLYSQSHTFPGATPCATSGCTWKAPDRATAETNQFEAATNAHVLVSRFHDYLTGGPIGFDEASGNFQRVNTTAAGIGGDYVKVEINDGEGLNNANFSTPPDGKAPRMQMFLFSGFNVNGADVTDVVYHEYGHGLSNRLVVNASGQSTLASDQARMMGEAWSDFYALDLLNTEGTLPDTAAPGEVATGRYVNGGNGIRRKPIDCPVDPAGTTPACNANGTATTVLGGYTYGDLADTNNTTPHNGGEVWAETLWDLRAAVGRSVALALVTGGMRLSPADPSMLTMRDAILQQAVAMRSAPGAADDHYADVWRVFAARGFGASATTDDGTSTTPDEAFDLPHGLRAAGPATVTDPYPGGDDDGIFERGETVSVAQPITGIGPDDLAGVTGTLSTATPGADILDGTAAWPLLGRGRTAANADPLLVRLPATSCAEPVALNVAVTSVEGGVTPSARVDMRPGDNHVVAIHDNATATATFEAVGTGKVSDIDLRIDELRHTFLGDIVITLSHDGVTSTVFDPADDWDAADIVDAIIDDQATTAMPTTGSGPVTGRVRPSTPGALAAFHGHPVAGTWTLSIADGAAGDSGELRRWGLDGPEVGCSPAEIPAAQSRDADSVAQTAATLHGDVTPNGRATGLRFAYGTTTAYGQTTPTQDVGSGSAAVAGSAALVGLEPGTTYHGRVEAIRENGVVAVTGTDVAFTTPPVLGPPLTTSTITPPPIVRPPTIPVDRTAPRFTKRPAVKLGKRSKGRRAATVGFALSEPATVTVALARKTTGVRVGRRCLARSSRRHGRSCARLVPVGKTLRKAFKMSKALKLALGRLPAGAYVATVRATDAAGNRSKATTVTFRVR